MEPIVIQEYDPAWPVNYDVERQEIVDALDDLLAGIEHVGSTAVPGLAAKPTIDIMPGVRTDADLDACVDPLKNIGYHYVSEYEQQMPFRRFFKKRPPESRHAVSVHVVVRDSDFWERHLLFRDYLRTHDAAARQYERLKRDLAPRFADVNDYAGAKTEFIRAVEVMARGG